MSVLAQQDFSAGVVQSRKAPANAVYDALNALIDDEGNLFRRCGSSNYSASDISGPAIDAMWDGYLAIGPRTVLLDTDASNQHLHVLNPTTSVPIDLGSVLSSAGSVQSMVEVGGVLFWSYASPAGGGIRSYAGATTLLTYVTGSITVTKGSATATGTGTAFTTAGVTPGMILNVTSTTLGDYKSYDAVIATVDSNTQLTLREPWPTTTITSSYAIRTWDTLIPIGLPSLVTNSWRYLGTVARRLLIAIGGRLYFSLYGVPSAFDANDYHEFALGAKITGVSSIENTAFVFATSGVWTVSNMELDPIDDFGNVQHSVAQISRDVLLWGERGIAAWANRLIVPALDDIYLFSVGAAPQPISAAIRNSYRAHVAAGHAPGRAAVHRGHYFLPILDASGSVLEVWVCRLDRGAAWTRWAGHAASRAYAQAARDDAAPKLLGVNAKRVTDLTGCLNTSGNASDADGTTPTFQFDTSDFDTGPGFQPSTVTKVRGQYETTGGTPAFTVGYAVGPAGASFTVGGVLKGSDASDGTGWSAWRIGKSGDRVRFRVSLSSAVTSAIWRGLEVHVRETGRT